ASARDVGSSGQPGWIRATLVRDPNGHAALFEDGRPIGVKMVPSLRRTAEKALESGACDVLAYTACAGEALVCERLMEAAAPTLVQRLSYATWAPRFLGLALLATVYWLVVGFPLVRALVAL